MDRREFLKSAGIGLAAAMTVPAFAGKALAKTPVRVGGGGEATAEAFVQYVGLDGVIRNVPSINTIGNRFTFGFKGVADGESVQGQMQFVDHALGLVIHSDIESLGLHMVHSHPVGASGSSAMRCRSSLGEVIINGERRPGWRFVNSPFFDGGEGSGTDTVCFELFDAAGVRIRQWSARVTSGNVQVQA